MDAGGNLDASGATIAFDRAFGFSSGSVRRTLGSDWTSIWRATESSARGSLAEKTMRKRFGCQVLADALGSGKEIRVRGARFDLGEKLPIGFVVTAQIVQRHLLMSSSTARFTSTMTVSGARVESITTKRCGCARANSKKPVR